MTMWPPSKLLRALIAAFVFLVLVGYGAYHFTVSPSAKLKYMQRISGVQLPGGVRDVSVYDNGDMYVTAHVLLPHDAVKDFAKTFSFAPTPYPEYALSSMAPLMGMEALDPRFRKIPLDADLAENRGRSQKNRWTFLLDRRSGHLWFIVEYADYGGDPP